MTVFSLGFGIRDLNVPFLAAMASPQHLLAMASPSGGQNAWVQFMPLVLVVAIFYFIIFLPMKRRQQKVRAFLSALKVGDRVVTSGGIYGTITKVNDQMLQIQIADKVRVEVARSAIVGYQGQEPVAAPETS
jgi:preprotein translocase subunit YajC